MQLHKKTLTTPYSVAKVFAFSQAKRIKKACLYKTGFSFLKGVYD